MVWLDILLALFKIPHGAPVPVPDPVLPAPEPEASPAPAPVAPGVGITREHLRAMGVSADNAARYIDGINESCERFNIDTNARICAFIAQILEETGNLAMVNENLNYGAARLTQVWPSRFPTIEAAQPYAGNPEKLANAVYGGRLGNSDPGDGYKYRGRGFIQLTFKGNYQASSDGLGVDLVSDPDLVSTPEYCALTSAEYWTRNGCNEMADGDSLDAITRITKRINGGYVNLDTRKANWQKAKRVFSDLA